MKIYVVEVGILLDEKNEDYDLYNVNINGKDYGLYDENVCSFIDKEKALSFLKEYVAVGVPNTYGVMVETEREIEDYEMKDLVEIAYLEDMYIPRTIQTEHFYTKKGE